MILTKKEVAELLLSQGDLLVFLNPCDSTVIVPSWYKHHDVLVLQFDRDPIPDIRVDDAGITGTLSFMRTPYKCFVPWDSVFALGDGTGALQEWLTPTLPFAAPSQPGGGKRLPNGWVVYQGGRNDDKGAA